MESILVVGKDEGWEVRTDKEREWTSGEICWAVLSHSVMSDSATLWTVACQAPLFMGFSRQEYWVGCHALLQRIFPAQGRVLTLMHCRQILDPLSHQGCPLKR